MEDGRIQDSQITASSSWNGNHGPPNGRLNRPSTWPASAGCWIAGQGAQDVNQWIQVSFEEFRWISGVITQGRSTTNGDHYFQWVKKYKVQYYSDKLDWLYVKDRSNGEVRIQFF